MYPLSDLLTFARAAPPDRVPTAAFRHQLLNLAYAKSRPFYYYSVFDRLYTSTEVYDLWEAHITHLGSAIGDPDKSQVYDGQKWDLALVLMIDAASGTVETHFSMTQTKDHYGNLRRLDVGAPATNGRGLTLDFDTYANSITTAFIEHQGINMATYPEGPGLEGIPKARAYNQRLRELHEAVKNTPGFLPALEEQYREHNRLAAWDALPVDPHYKCFELMEQHQWVAFPQYDCWGPVPKGKICVTMTLPVEEFLSFCPDPIFDTRPFDQALAAFAATPYEPNFTLGVPKLYHRDHLLACYWAYNFDLEGQTNPYDFLVYYLTSCARTRVIAEQE